MANLVVYKVKIEKLKRKKIGIESALEYYQGKLDEAYKKQRDKQNEKSRIKRKYRKCKGVSKR